MKTQEILTIVALSALGLCLLCGLAKMAMKNPKKRSDCDKACGALFFVAVALMAVSQLLEETKSGFELASGSSENCVMKAKSAAKLTHDRVLKKCEAGGRPTPRPRPPTPGPKPPHHHHHHHRKSDDEVCKSFYNQCHLGKKPMYGEMKVDCFSAPRGKDGRLLNCYADLMEDGDCVTSDGSGYNSQLFQCDDVCNPCDGVCTDATRKGRNLSCRDNPAM